MLIKIGKLTVAKATMLVSSKYASVVFYLVVFILLLGFYGEQIFTRERGESFSLKTGINEGIMIKWKAWSKLMINPSYLASKITAKNISIYVWNDAVLSSVLFATPEASIECHENSTAGTSVIAEPYMHPNLVSDYLLIQSEDTASLLLEPLKSYGAISFSSTRDHICFAYYLDRNDSKASNAEENLVRELNRLQTYGEISGPNGSSFTVVKDSDNEVTCRGTFKEFHGSMQGTQYRGEGAASVMGLKLQSKPGDIRSLVGSIFSSLEAERVQGIHVTAWGNVTVRFGLPVEKVRITGLNPTQFMYHGVPNQIVDESQLSISFDDNAPGKFIIDQTKQTIEISGTVHHINLNGKNIMQRLIDKWPWYLQSIFGALTGIVAKQLYTSWKKILHANQSFQRRTR